MQKLKALFLFSSFIMFMLTSSFSFAGDMQALSSEAQKDKVLDNKEKGDYHQKAHKKKHKYGKRTHRLGFDFSSILWSSRNPKNVQFMGDYGYNFGYVEVGPSLGLLYVSPSSANNSYSSKISLGGWGELNLFKNTKKNCLIPGLGLSVYTHKLDSFSINPYLFLKIFPFKRSAFILSLNYNYHSPYPHVQNQLEVSQEVSPLLTSVLLKMTKAKDVSLNLSYAFYFK